MKKLTFFDLILLVLQFQNGCYIGVLFWEGLMISVIVWYEVLSVSSKMLERLKRNIAAIIETIQENEHRNRGVPHDEGR